MVFINWLAKVTNEPVVRGVVSVWVASNKDCRNRVPRIDEMFVELDSGHCRRMDVSDQAGGFRETRGGEEIGRRRESLDGVAQRPHEPSHGFAIEVIIIYERDQWCLRHAASDSSLEPNLVHRMRIP
jgi:hypothetical protein